MKSQTTTKGADALLRFPKITSIHAVKWSPALNAVLPKLGSLNSIWAPDAGLTGDDLQAICKVADLKYLMISGNKLPGSSYSELCALHMLSQLGLSNTTITDSDILNFAVDMPKLVWLSIEETNVSRRGYNSFVAAAPKVIVIWAPRK
jgi:hypothetical protein